MDNIYIGVDVGSPNITIGAITDKGKIIKKKTVNLSRTIGDGVSFIDAIIESIYLFINDINLSIHEIESVGLGFPGTVDSKKGIIVFAPNMFFTNFEVKQILEQAFDCPIYIGQDSRVAAWGEYNAGRGENHNNFALIKLDVGIGCGIVINGLLYHGPFNTAGEFGHQLIDVDGPQCNCGRRGCLETYCGKKAIEKAGEEIKEGLKLKDIYILAQQGDDKALRITDQVVEKLGIGIVNLVNLLSLELIAISGWINDAPDELLLNPLREFVRTHAYPAIAHKVEIIRSVLGNDAPLIGAALQDETTEY